jgi:hypothetical protein
MSYQGTWFLGASREAGKTRKEAERKTASMP